MRKTVSDATTRFIDALLEDGLEIHFRRPKCAYPAAGPIEVKVVKFDGTQVWSWSKICFFSDMQDAVCGSDAYLRLVLQELWQRKNDQEKK